MGRVPTVDDTCIGCDVCVTTLPSVYKLNEEGISVVINPLAGTEELVQQTIDDCPVEAISWEGEGPYEGHGVEVTPSGPAVEVPAPMSGEESGVEVAASSEEGSPLAAKPEPPRPSLEEPPLESIIEPEGQRPGTSYGPREVVPPPSLAEVVEEWSEAVPDRLAAPPGERPAYFDQLEALLGERASFDPEQVAEAGFDGEAMPGELAALMEPRAEVVVWPTTPAEVVQLTRLAQGAQAVLVPRGGNTEGLGGTTPVKGGVMVNLTRLNRLLKLEAEAEVVTVEAGMTIQDLQEQLADQKLSLAVVPGPAGATVGGCLAAGGWGLGSLDKGSLATQVVELELVTPQAETMKLKGEELKLALGAWGTTGTITKATLKVARLEPFSIMAATVENVEELTDLTVNLGHKQQELEIELRAVQVLSPAQTARHTRVLPEARLPRGHWLVMLAFVGRKGANSRLQGWVKEQGGVALGSEVSQKLWELRVSGLAVERGGSHLASSQVLLPYDMLGEFWSLVGEEVEAARVRMEGQLIDEERYWIVVNPFDGLVRPDFYQSLSVVLAVVSAAKSLGGQAAATGLWQAGEAKAVLGRQTLKKLRRFKARYDPADLQNPGKVWGSQVKLFKLIPFPLRSGWLSKLLQLPLMMTARLFPYTPAQEAEPDQLALARTMDLHYGRNHW